MIIGGMAAQQRVPTNGRAVLLHRLFYWQPVAIGMSRYWVEWNLECAPTKKYAPGVTSILADFGARHLCRFNARTIVRFESRTNPPFGSDPEAA